MSDRDERPLCECHGEPMFWNKDVAYTGGGRWRCIVKKREADRRYVSRHPLVCQHRNEQRVRIGGVYMGRIGFTEKERREITGGSSE